MARRKSFRYWFRTLEPRVLDMLRGPLWERYKPWLDRRNVLNFSRQPLALGVAIGMFCGLIPGPLQVLGTLGLCAWWRANVVAGVITTLYTNALTIVPLYMLAFQIGTWILPGSQSLPPLVAINFSSFEWISALVQWTQALGWPLVVGLPVMGLWFAASAYCLVQAFWLAPVVRRARAIRRRSAELAEGVVKGL